MAASLEFLEAQRRLADPEALPAPSWPPSSPPSPSSPSSPPRRFSSPPGRAGAGPAVGARVQDAAAAAFDRIYNHGEWLCGNEAQSGLGSRWETTKEFCDFLAGFLRDQRITSVVDAGCGHWPTGYQRFIDWQGVRYEGVDLVPRVVADNAAYFAGEPTRLDAHGLVGASFRAGDVSQVLPAADLLLVKDVLMHLPNAAILQFLRNNVSDSTPRHRMVLLVQNEVPRAINLRQAIDIEPGQLLPFNIAAPPFSAPFVDIFRWQSDEPKVVQFWAPGLG